MRRSICWLCICALGAAGNWGRGEVVSTFDTGADGWTIVGDAATPAYLASGGNPGGFIRGSDFVGGQTWYFSAPAKFLGNAWSAYGTDLLFDLSQQYSGAASQYKDNDVVLAGGGVTLAFNTAVNPGLYPEWSTYRVLLHESAGWRVGNTAGVPATAEQMRTVLASLTVLRIRGEFQSGGDIGSLDNVRLMTGLPGDANRDGRIGPDDFALTDRGRAMGWDGWSNGDFNGDGVVNAADVVIVDTALKQQGGFSPAAVLVAAVPEPGGVVGAIAAITVARGRRWRAEWKKG